MRSLLTVPVARLTALEDRHVDAVALGARGDETMLVALRARGWIDLNRSPLRDRDPQVDAGAEPRIAGMSASDKVRSGIGLIPRPLAVGPSHAVLEALLPADWTAQQVYDHHEVFMLHGQRCCFFRAPACGRCVLLDLCPEGQARRRGGAARHEAPPPPPLAPEPGL